MLNQERVSRIRAAMKEQGFTQILITDDAACFYLTGRKIAPMERCGALLLKDTGEIHAFMNRLFCFDPMEGMTMHYYSDGEDPYALIAKELSPGPVGFDQNWLTRHTLSVLAQRDDIRPLLGSAPVDTCRAYKDEAEKALLRRSSQVNDLAMADAVAGIGGGVDEQALSQRVTKFFDSHGATGNTGGQLVCYGANAAEPHHVSAAGVLPKPGDAVLMDIFAPIGHYWCDMTRTVFYRECSEEHRRVYEIVKDAQQAAIDAVRPGVPLREIDAAARNIIDRAGYGKYFITRTGHGAGISIHEAPDVSPTSAQAAETGMCFSIEPGIYLPGDVGVRIEDLVIVTEDGCEVLTHYPKELQITG